uniref:Uncharacterized protein n=1 Tax=Cacopsylla melanoneura TaxID=428564 RepID=A0A8D8XN48_9HEMI
MDPSSSWDMYREMSKQTIWLKKGANILFTPMRNLPFDSIKRLVNLQSNQHHKKWIKNAGADKNGKEIINNPDIIPELPRKAAVATFRLLTGHDCLAQHLNRIGCKDSPICPLCSDNALMNAYCSLLRPIRIN